MCICVLMAANLRPQKYWPIDCLPVPGKQGLTEWFCTGFVCDDVCLDSRVSQKGMILAVFICLHSRVGILF